MRQFFQLDGPIFSFLSKVADLLILNVLFILTSLPIVTIGASLTGLSYATLKMHGEEEGYAWKNYLKSFRQNLKQGTIIWIILAVAAIMLYFDYAIAANSGGMIFTVVRYGVILGAFLWLMIFFYVFPMLSKFENTVATTISNALLLAISNLPRTIMMFVVLGALIVLTMWNTTTFAFGLLLWILFGAAFISWVNTGFINKAFEKIIPEEDKNNVTADDAFVLRDEAADEVTDEAFRDE